MGDKVGRVYVDSQDLSSLQSRKFKGLKRGPPAEKPMADANVAPELQEVVANVSGGEGRKRARV